MKKYLANFLKFKPLLGELVSRDIKTKYRKSILGVLWTLLNPLFMMLILSIVFSSIFKFEVEKFPLYILSGQVIFNFYSEATTSAMSSIIGSSALIKKVYIPKYLFPVSKVLSSAINIMASFFALIIVMVVTRADLHFSILLIPIPIICVSCFSMGIGLILAAYAVKFRDILHLYSVFITGYMYLTPIIYPINILPARVKFFVLLNPLTSILNMFRGFAIYNEMPSAFTMLMSTIPSVLVLFLGVWLFHKRQDSFILYV